MIERILTSKYFWILLLLGLFLYWRFRQQITAAIIAQRTGHQAVQEAGTSGYTTYNTSFYSPPSWFPTLKFFKANPYVPPVQAAMTHQQVYSQGNS
jgi:hypothetical protein